MVSGLWIMHWYNYKLYSLVVQSIKPWWGWAAAHTWAFTNLHSSKAWRYESKEMKYSEKAFKSKLNPINDSFKRSVPYIYKSTLMGLCAIWLLTFAVSQNTVQVTWVLTSSLKTPHYKTFWWGKSFTSDFWFKARHTLLHTYSQPRTLHRAQRHTPEVLLREIIFMPYCSTYL